ncbi:Fic family protein, partial [uncultured Dubosiella sp.]
SYTPPFTMTDKITSLVIEIGELVGKITVSEAQAANLVLRRENQIKTIQSSLAIENNSLTVDQVTDIINGKRVLAPPSDIREAKNAYEAYEILQTLDPYSLNDLLKAHAFMMNGLIKDAGRFRSKNAGVYSGTTLIHAGTPAHYIPEVMKQLFNWLRYSNTHPLIKSCVFHYEFEFIHPFADGNGRTGRLWHSLILQTWKPFFAWIPIETLIHKNQQEYYWAINASNTKGESTIFVEFMLRMIRQALNQFTPDVGINVGTNVGINSLEDQVVSLLKDNPSHSARSLGEQLGLSQRQVERVLAKLKKDGTIKRTGSNKSGSWQVIK